jgi:hypothetical protein
MLRCVVEQTVLDVLEIAMLAQTGMYVGAGRLTLAQEHVIHEHATATEYHGMGHNGAISEDTNGIGGRHDGALLWLRGEDCSVPRLSLNAGVSHTTLPRGERCDRRMSSVTAQHMP